MTTWLGHLLGLTTSRSRSRSVRRAGCGLLSLSTALTCCTTVQHPTRGREVAPQPQPSAAPAVSSAPFVVERLTSGGCAVLRGGDRLCPAPTATPENGCRFESVGAHSDEEGNLGAGAGWECRLGQDGAILCWGKNPEGGLGDGRSHEAQRPVRVKLPKAARQLAVGYHHACALLEDQTTWCWGENSRGALGLGVVPACCDIPDPTRPHEYLTPQRVSSLPASASIHALGDASCALTLQGDVYCWGENGSGELGSPATSEPLPSPTRVAGLPAIKQLVMDEPSCGLSVAGDSYCWGDGCPLLARSATPVKIDWNRVVQHGQRR